MKNILFELINQASPGAATGALGNQLCKLIMASCDGPTPGCHSKTNDFCDLRLGGNFLSSRSFILSRNSDYYHWSRRRGEMPEEVLQAMILHRRAYRYLLRKTSVVIICCAFIAVSDLEPMTEARLSAHLEESVVSIVPLTKSALATTLPAAMCLLA